MGWVFCWLVGLYGAVQSPKTIIKAGPILSQPVMLPSTSFTARVHNEVLSFLDSKAVFPVNQQLVCADVIDPHCDFSGTSSKAGGQAPYEAEQVNLQIQSTAYRIAVSFFCCLHLSSGPQLEQPYRWDVDWKVSACLCHSSYLDCVGPRAFLQLLVFFQTFRPCFSSSRLISPGHHLLLSQCLEGRASFCSPSSRSTPTMQDL